MKKFKAKVIEIYPYEGKAAIEFSWRNRKRIECVNLYQGPDCKQLFTGMKGWASYLLFSNGGTWAFEPFKKGTSL